MPIRIRLDRMLVDRQMQLNELAEQVGVSVPNLSRLKRGHVKAVRFSTLEALCKALDCQPSDLLIYEPEQE